MGDAAGQRAVGVAPGRVQRRLGRQVQVGAQLQRGGHAVVAQRAAAEERVQEVRPSPGWGRVTSGSAAAGGWSAATSTTRRRTGPTRRGWSPCRSAFAQAQPGVELAGATGLDRRLPLQFLALEAVGLVAVGAEPEVGVHAAGLPQPQRPPQCARRRVPQAGVGPGLAEGAAGELAGREVDAAPVQAGLGRQPRADAPAHRRLGQAGALDVAARQDAGLVVGKLRQRALHGQPQRARQALDRGPLGPGVQPVAAVVVEAVAREAHVLELGLAEQPLPADRLVEVALQRGGVDGVRSAQAVGHELTVLGAQQVAFVADALRHSGRVRAGPCGGGHPGCGQQQQAGAG